MDYDEYLKFRDDTASRREVHSRLRQLQESTSRNAIGGAVTPDAWKEVDTNWQKVEAQVRFNNLVQ